MVRTSPFTGAVTSYIERDGKLYAYKVDAAGKETLRIVERPKPVDRTKSPFKR